MILFNKKYCIPICLKNTSPYVRKAADDLSSDFGKISKNHICAEIISEEIDGCIIIDENPFPNDDPIEHEAFSIKTEGKNIRISAGGYLGSMWGIYTFSEKILGINPCYLFNDLQLQEKSELEVGHIDISEEPNGFKFRGMFINDEDLLTGWKDGGKIRYVPYLWYGLTIEESVIDMVAETAVRLKINTLVPASLLDIENPGEKIIIDCVAKRGIYLSQHHIEPVGVSGYTFENYLKRNNKVGSFSYFDNPELLEEAWKHYAEKWSEYDNVIWTIGLRGIADNPFWGKNGDKVSDVDWKKYGDLISQVYAKQTEIIKTATNGKAKHFASSLWMEGATLMKKGVLTFPKDTIIQFSDVGHTHMFADDFYFSERNPDYKYGIYYHTQYFSHGPHLAPQLGLNKLCYNTNLAYDRGDREFYLMNVSNIREFVYEIEAYSKLAWDVNTFSANAYKKEYCKKFGKHSEKIEELIESYYNNLPELDDRLYTDQNPSYELSCNFNNIPSDFKYFIATDGTVSVLGKWISRVDGKIFRGQLKKKLCTNCYEALVPVIPEFEKLRDEFSALLNDLDEANKKHIECKWLLYINTLLAIYTWYVNLYEAKIHCDNMESEEMKQSLRKACQQLEDYLEHRKIAEHGIFENWFRGESKIDVKQLLYNTKRLLGHT